LAESASFDVLIDKIRRVVLLYSTTRKKGREAIKKLQDVIFQLFVGRAPLGRFP